MNAVRRTVSPLYCVSHAPNEQTIFAFDKASTQIWNAKRATYYVVNFYAVSLDAVVYFNAVVSFDVVVVSFDDDGAVHFLICGMPQNTVPEVIISFSDLGKNQAPTSLCAVNPIVRVNDIKTYFVNSAISIK